MAESVRAHDSTVHAASQRSLAPAVPAGAIPSAVLAVRRHVWVGGSAGTGGGSAGERHPKPSRSAAHTPQYFEDRFVHHSTSNSPLMLPSSKVSDTFPTA